MRATPASAIPAIALLFGCACSGGPPQRRINAFGPAPPTVPTIAELEAGTVVTVLPVRITRTGTGARTLEPEAFDGLLREALRQSVHLDFASGVEAPDDPGVRIAVTADPTSRNLTSSLLRPAENGATETSRPLASASFTDRSLHRAIDRLAWSTREALGDRPDPGTTHQVSRIYSNNIGCVRSTERATEQLARGRIGAAQQLLRRAREADGGCTLTLALLCATLADSGSHEQASEIATEALRLHTPRTSPTTRVRLARTLLLARAASAPNRRETRGHDGRLLALGEATLRERPHDPHARLTRALANNFLGDFESASRDFALLRDRWPSVGSVAYHFAFAELAAGRPRRAAEILQSAHGVLPAERRLLPESLARFHSGDREALRVDLETNLRTARSRSGGAASQKAHELHRMLASLAILTGDRARATHHLLEDLEWLRQDPTLLSRSAIELVEVGEALIHLGAANALADRLTAMQAVLSHATQKSKISQAITYLAGLVLIESAHATDDEAPPAANAITTLKEGRATVWASLLRAANHRRRGELADETGELLRAAQATDAALIHAKLSRSLRALGRTDEADQVAHQLRGRLLRIDLRRRIDHPLLSPARALAFLATDL